MKRSSRAWIMLPVILIVIAAAGWLVSNYQKEAGLVDASKGGPNAVSTALIARDYSQGATGDDYHVYADALLVAEVAQRNLPVINAADTRVSHLLVEALDCLYAAREAWQADIDSEWNPAIHGEPGYWQALHPALAVSPGATLTASEVRRLASEQAAGILQQAVDLVT